MKKITMFMFASCPHCQRALALMAQLKEEHPNYAQIPFEMVDEQLDPVRAEQYDYWYVPSYFVGDEKLHEGTATKEQIQNVFEAALQ